MTKLWMEDDATAGHDPDHETLEMAWQRMYNEDFHQVKSTARHVDEGDADMYYFPDGRVACSSYPGNSFISKVS